MPLDSRFLIALISILQVEKISVTFELFEAFKVILYR
ncbi:hypothetical protein Fsol_00642 [Candidatus Fokinia solitaria]|uniref:Uncharacterized protein n=1 Tax=Candidatus Fokinia solitaria TaxID=1802984 RepID=A0A2U8BSV2_9RICK|nr:hypothetical protein Fsol_00642 [Candidatus Fokinia solitaria]